MAEATTYAAKVKQLEAELKAARAKKEKAAAAVQIEAALVRRLKAQLDELNKGA